jgi:hypothetical protein
MKKTVSVVTFIVALVLLTTVGSAQGTLPGAEWWSGEQVQNVGDEQATIVIEVYDKNSSAIYTETKLVDSYDYYTFTPFFEFATMPDGFIGSAIVSSDQPIKAIVNVTNIPAGPFGETGGKAAAQYVGFDDSAVDTMLLFPIAKGDYYGATTTYYIQNAGTVATTAAATFTMSSGATYAYTTPSFGPGQMVIFSIYDTTYTPPGAHGDAGRVGSLVVTADEPLAGVGMEHKTTESPATLLQGTRGLTSADYDDKAYAPVIKHEWYHRFTGIQVQNVGMSQITATVTYQGNAGDCAGKTYVQEHVVDALDSYAFVQFTGYTPLDPPCSASATITATGDFVAVVNEGNLPTGTAAGITYFAMPDSAVTTKVSAPNFKDDYYNATSGMLIQNVGVTTATNIVATFQCTPVGGSSFTAISEPQEAGPGAGVLFWRPSVWPVPSMFTTGNPFSSADALCAVIVTADQPIVVVVNEAGFGQVIDDNNYEGFNLAP